MHGEDLLGRARLEKLREGAGTLAVARRDGVHDLGLGADGRLDASSGRLVYASTRLRTIGSSGGSVWSSAKPSPPWESWGIGAAIIATARGQGAGGEHCKSEEGPASHYSSQSDPSQGGDRSGRWRVIPPE